MRTRSLSVLVLVIVSGCGGSKYSPVSGTVTLDGQPLANVVVSFQPISAELNSGPGSTGRTNDKGEYTLEVVGGGNGAVDGWHKVTIRPVVEGNPAGAKLIIPAKYNSKSELKFEVKSGGNTANFDLKLK
jgi:hypothetical protein